jgi:hypothetical protein
VQAMMVKRQLQSMSNVPRESGLETKLVVTLGVVQVVSNSVYARAVNARERMRSRLDIRRWAMP